MPSAHITQRKIVADSTTNSWTQAYHAGNLFIAVSLTTNEKREELVSAVGKDLINNIEAEFFSLEKKDLDSIKEAVITGLSSVPKDLSVSFALAYIHETILYGIVSHAGHIMLKRQETVGTVLASAAKDQPGQLTSASGFLQNDDIVLLETEAFTHFFTRQEVTHALSGTTLDEIEGEFTGKMQSPGSEGVAAIVIHFTSPPASSEPEPSYATTDAVIEEKGQEAPREEQKKSQATESEQEDLPASIQSESRSVGSDMAEKESFFTTIIGVFRGMKPKSPVTLPHKRKVILSIVVILIFILVGSIVLTITNKDAAKRKALFDSVYPQAQKYYDVGQGIAGLNPEGAQEDYQKAKKILTNVLPNFKKGSDEEGKISDLLHKVDKETTGTTDSNSLQTKEVTEGSQLLSLEKNNNNIIEVTADDKTIYGLTTTEVVSQDIGSDKVKKIIKNGDDWSDAVGIGTFLGNMYILDKKNGLLKYVITDQGYTKTSYFKSDSPDLSKAVSMTIDGSVYILFSDGIIKKYTKASQDEFSVSGVTPGLGKATKLFTGKDLNSLYVLDPGNSRILRLSKTGAFQEQYRAKVLKNTQDIDVQENGKKIFILSNNKLIKLSLP